jgi:hypothetical protein
MKPIDFRGAFYIKLGRSGNWEEESLRTGKIRFGWEGQTVADINTGNWARIRAQLRRTSKTPGKATADLNALRLLVESSSEDVWVTFSKGMLHWCRMRGGQVRSDNISKYRGTKGPWRATAINGEHLVATNLPGTLTRLQGFRGTICSVRAFDALRRVLNNESSPEFLELKDARANLVNRVALALGELHWKDFETLADLLFRATGWRRTSMVGEQLEGIDLALEDPVTRDRYIVQVKSVAGLKDVRRAQRNAASTYWRRLYLLVHKPALGLAAIAGQSRGKVEVILAPELAERVVDAGLVNWLMKRLR